MPHEPIALFIIVPSRSSEGEVSLRPYPRDPDGPTLQSRLTSAGFKAGDVVEVRISHITRISEKQDTPPPGQLIRRPRGRR